MNSGQATIGQERAQKKGDHLDFQKRLVILGMLSTRKSENLLAHQGLHKTIQSDPVKNRDMSTVHLH
jgi:hypothetical protein